MAEVVGAVNAARTYLGTSIDQANLEQFFAAFWEGKVNLSGLQISAPGINDLKGAYETDQPALYFRYPTTPLPDQAGGPNGIAPVFAPSVRWNDRAWSATTDRFDTAGAMHAANEMIWLHGDEISGFPDLTL